MLNSANLLTLSRLPIAIVFFWLITLETEPAYAWAFRLLIVAGITDLLDGYVARKLSGSTALGRVLDPLVDKVLVCCGFIFLVGRDVTIWTEPHMRHWAQVRAWMVALIIGREFMVTTMRSYSEASGRAFAATWMGKLKMFIQCVALGAVTWVQGDILGTKRSFWPNVFVVFCIWATVVVTAISGLIYLVMAKRKLAGTAPPSESAT